MVRPRRAPCNPMPRAEKVASMATKRRNPRYPANRRETCGPGRILVGYSLQLDVGRRIVKVVFASRCDNDEVSRAVTEARNAASGQVMGIVYDMRGCDRGGMTLADAFWMPRRHPSIRNDAQRLRIAAIYPDHMEELARFWETTSRNVGIKASAFPDEESALAWIAAGAEPER